MNAIFKLGISFIALDNFSTKFGNIQAKLGKFDGWANNVNEKMRGIITPFNALLVGVGRKVIKDFSETEDATIQLKNTMMGMGGVVSSEFDNVSKKAEELGAKLPGTTADFYKMASAMRTLGVSDVSLSSALEATAQMAVVLKPVGVSFEQASEATAKFKNALGIADNDMVAFADTIQRSVHLGAGLTEMQYAFSRMSGILKVMGMQGLESANNLTPLISMLIKTGKTGETVGTSLTKIFSLGIAKNQFSDIKGMFDFLAKNSNKNITKIFGGGDDTQTALLLKNMGLKGYLETIENLKNQGSLKERIEPSLKSLTNTFEAMGGAMNKVSVSIGKLFSSNLNGIASFLGGMADKVSILIDKFPILSKAIASVGLGLASISLFRGVGSVFGAIFGPGILLVKNFSKALSILNGVQAINRSLWASEVIKEYGIAGRGAVHTTKLMTLAQAGFNIVANMNPYLLLVTGVVALTGVLVGLSYIMRDNITQQSIYNDIKKEAKQRILEEKAELKMLFDEMKNLEPKSKARLDIIKKLQDKYPSYIKGMKLEKMTAQELAATYNNVAEAMDKKAEAEVMYEKKKELYKKIAESKLDQQQEIDDINSGFWGITKIIFKDILHLTPDYKKDQENAQKQIEFYNQIEKEKQSKEKSNITITQNNNFNAVNEKTLPAIQGALKKNNNQLIDNRGYYNYD